VERFDHRAFYDGERHRIEMHLVSRDARTVTIPAWARLLRGRREHPHRGELQARPCQRGALFAAAGLAVERWETDGLFAIAWRAGVSVRPRLPPAVLRADLERRVFGLGAPPRGPPHRAEVELIRGGGDGSRVPVVSDGGPRRCAAAPLRGGRGGARSPRRTGCRASRCPDGGIVSYEPGGRSS
jgi:hypothetical protein